MRGNRVIIGSGGRVLISGDNIKRVYFPWTMESRGDPERLHIFADMIITPRMNSGIITDDETLVVVPLDYYNSIITTGEYSENVEPEQIRIERIFPANVSYLFNYSDAPNNNYFFVDYVEQTEAIRKPPYDPEREGYRFAGWYKDAECTIPWNFDSDIVAINYDENGDRIYEEISLYAKWIIKNWWEFWK